MSTSSNLDISEPPALNAVMRSNCGICNKKQALYSCPRCNRPYCSVVCYQDKLHADCSEAFYHECVKEELSARAQLTRGDPESRRRVEEALFNLYQQNAEDDPRELAGSADSDDDSDEEDLADRLKGIDLNDANAVWAQLSESERAGFNKMIQTGEIQHLLPDWKPWWVCKPIEEVNGDEDQLADIPDIVDNVPAFSELCKSKPAPAPSLPFNVANAIAGYVYCMRLFEGDIYVESVEACSVICSLAGSLLRKENYSSLSQAVAAVSVKAIASNEASGDVINLLTKDVDYIIRNPTFSMAALSDLLTVFQVALKCHKKRKSHTTGAFSRQFSSDSNTKISASDLKIVIKKLVYYVSWAKELKLTSKSNVKGEEGSELNALKE